MMQKKHFVSPDELAALDLIGTPTWIFDVTRHAMWWGNRAALKFWGCETLAELCARDYSSDTNTVRERLRDIIAQTPPGETIMDMWTFYPDGRPTPTHQRMTPVCIGAEQRDGLLIETTLVDDQKLDAMDRRLIEATHYSPFLLSFCDHSGDLLFQNPRSADVYGGSGYDADAEAPFEGKGFIERFADPVEGRAALTRARDRGILSDDFQMRTTSGVRWHHVTVRGARDPGAGGESLLLIEEDVTSLKRAERAVAESATLLQDAVESLADGFILTDADERIVLVNSRYKEIYPELAHLSKPGVFFEDLMRAASAIHPSRYVETTREDWVQNRMAQFRDGAASREVQKADGRWLRITDRKTSTGGVAGSRVDITELKQALQASESASAAKSEFLSSMSHELRTPLHSVLGFAQILERDRSSPLSERQSRAVGMIKSSGEHLLSLIEGILDLSRIETGQLDVNLETVDLRTILDDCIAVAQSLAKQKAVQIIDQTKGHDLNKVMAEPTRLKQVLLNLLSNAVKYNRQGGHVSIDVDVQNAWSLKISIADTGPGIAAEDYPRVFAPFDRLGRESLEIEGTGIGLTLSKKLIELMNGSIGFDSDIGTGSTFWFTINTDKSSRADVQAELERVSR